MLHGFANSFYALGLVWKFDRRRVLLIYLSQLLSFGFWVFETVVFMRYLFGAADLNRTFGQVALFVCLTVAAMMLFQLFSAWVDRRFRPVSDIRLYQAINGMIFEKAANVELQCYEDADFYTDYTKSSSEAFTRAVGAVDQTAGFLASVLSSIFVVVNIFSINRIIGLASIVPLVLNVVLGMRGGQIDYDKRMEQVPSTRRQDYVNRAVYLQKYAKELRLTSIFSVLAGIYEKATEENIRITKKHWKRLTAFSFIKNLICYPIFFEGSWLLAAYLAMVVHSITVSDFVVLANSAVSATWMLFSMTDNLVGIYSNALYIDNLKAFLDYRESIPENQDGLDVPEEIRSLELRGVSFRYKPDRPEVLRDIDMTIEQGKIISLVGHNGSGKSTLIKLIMRLYDPTGGQILLNGIDIRKYNLHQYRALIATTFQDFQIFSATVEENAVMGNETIGEPRAAAATALGQSGIWSRIASLDRGMDSMLTREFDENGVLLSGGEEQKVAIARAFAKKSSILLLDEPSSALDPIAEYRIHRNYIALCNSMGKNGGGKISVFISHRLSTAAIADHVYLLEGGRIAESGDHKELMRLGGVYAGMYRKQAQNYSLGVEGA